MLKILTCIIGLVSFLILSGCTSTSTVHVFSKYMTSEETQQVTNWLVERGYVVEANNHEFPPGILNSTLVFAPGLKSDAEIGPLLDSYYAKNGEALTVRYFGSGKHRFTKDNIGLYIYGSKKPVRPEEFEIPLTTEFTAVKCDVYGFAYLNVTDDGFELSIGNDSPEQAQESKHVGRWELKGHELNLYKEKALWVAMKVQEIEEMTEYGLKKGLVLTPTLMKENIDNCVFEYIVILK